jgi:plastocyanin
LRLLIAALALCTSLVGENVNGFILIRKRLTRQSVTSPVSLYQRGPAVALGKDPEEDPLGAERARVAIWVEGVGSAHPLKLSMQQESRRFSPDLVVIPVGSTVSFPNMDPIFHNVFSLSKPREFDLGNYPKGETRNVKFPKPGIVYVNCRLHPDMTAAIVVAPNDWCARAERGGQFILHDLPPGDYTVVAWHKTAGFFRKRISIVAGQDTALEFFIPIGADEPPLRAAGK